MADIKEFDEKFGKSIRRRLPSAGSGFNPDNWEEFPSMTEPGESYKNDFWDVNSYYDPVASKGKDVWEVDPERVKYNTDLFHEWVGSFIGWAGANKKLFTKGYNHEGYNVDGADYSYPEQRARRTEQMINTINNRLYNEETDFKTEYGHFDGNDKFLSHTKNTDNQVDRIKFAIEQMVNLHGPKIAEDLDKIEHPEFLTFDDYHDWETALSTGNDFNLRQRYNNNLKVYGNIVDALNGTGMKPYKIYKDKNYASCLTRGMRAEETLRHYKLFGRKFVKKM